MHECFKDLQLPCRWVPDMGYGFGYPQFNFYAPSVYYLGEVIHLLNVQFIDSVKIVVVLGFILSALAMFIFLRTLFGNVPALVGSLAYTYAPYKAVDVYVRGALSEFWAFIFFPLIFWAAYKFVKTRKIIYILAFSVSLGLLSITHNLMTFIFLPFAAVWVLTLIILDKKWKLVIYFLLGGLLAFLIGSFFLLPAVFESKYVHVDSVLSGYFDYRRHFASISQIFLSTDFGYGASEFGLGDDMSFSAGHIQWMTAFFGFILAIVSYFKRKERKLALLLVITGFLAIFSLFMIHPKSSPIWAMFHTLAYIQFPWRYLALSIFFLSILTAALIYYSKTYLKLQLILVVLTITSLIFVNISFFKPQYWYNISDDQKFSGREWEKQLTTSIFDYLPVSAQLPPYHEAPKFPEVLEGKADFKSYNKRSNYQMGEVIVEEDALIRLPIFDFPGMKVFANGSKIKHHNNDCRGQKHCFGLITFSLPKGSHKIEVRLTNTFIRTLGNSLTVVGVGVLVTILWRKIYEKEIN